MDPSPRLDDPRSGRVAPPPEAGDDRRSQIGADLANTVLETTARRLAEAVAEYDAALDRGALLHELQVLDRDVATAERHHAAAGEQAAP